MNPGAALGRWAVMEANWMTIWVVAPTLQPKQKHYWHAIEYSLSHLSYPRVWMMNSIYHLHIWGSFCEIIWATRLFTTPRCGAEGIKQTSKRGDFQVQRYGRENPQTVLQVPTSLRLNTKKLQRENVTGNRKTEGKSCAPVLRRASENTLEQRSSCQAESREWQQILQATMTGTIVQTTAWGLRQSMTEQQPNMFAMTFISRPLRTIPTEPQPPHLPSSSFLITFALERSARYPPF